MLGQALQLTSGLQGQAFLVRAARVHKARVGGLGAEPALFKMAPHAPPGPGAFDLFLHVTRGGSAASKRARQRHIGRPDQRWLRRGSGTQRVLGAGARSTARQQKPARALEGQQQKGCKLALRSTGAVMQCGTALVWWHSFSGDTEALHRHSLIWY